MNLFRILFLLCFFFTVYPLRGGYVVIDGKKHIVQNRGEMRYRLIPLGMMDYEVVKSVCSGWLSADGMIRHEKKRGSVMVYDYPDVIAKIRKFIASNMEEPGTGGHNIRVEVSFDGSSGSRVTDWQRGDNAVRHGRVVISGGKYNIPSGVEYRAPLSSLSASSSFSKQFIVVRDGYSAKLWVGENRVDPRWLNGLIGTNIKYLKDGGTVITKYGVDDELLFVDVGAVLMVRARLLGNNMIEVELYPEISYINGEGAQSSIEVRSIATRVVVRAGARINIGGMISSKLSYYRELFGKQLYRRVNGGNVLNMYLRATPL